MRCSIPGNRLQRCVSTGLTPAPSHMKLIESSSIDLWARPASEMACAVFAKVCFFSPGRGQEEGMGLFPSIPLIRLAGLLVDGSVPPHRFCSTPPSAFQIQWQNPAVKIRPAGALGTGRWPPWRASACIAGSNRALQTKTSRPQ